MHVQTLILVRFDFLQCCNYVHYQVSYNSLLVLVKTHGLQQVYTLLYKKMENK